MSLNKPPHNSLFSIVILCLIIVGCSNKKDDITSFPIITVKNNQLKPFLTFEEDSIARPIDIAILPNGDRAILDLELMSVIIYGKDGTFKHRLGREGKGPGEFVSPINIQNTDQFIYIADQRQLTWHKYTLEGKFNESIPAPDKVTGFYDTQLLNDNEYLSPAEGDRGHLLVYRNSQTDSTLFFGDAMGDSITTISLEENKRQAQNGEIADMFKNDVLIAQSGSHYYSFLKAYGRLQKYDHKGTLLWEKQLNLPFMQAIFDSYIKENKELRAATIHTLAYAQDMEINNDSIYLLMSKAEKKQKVILQLDMEGNIQKQYDLGNIGPAIFAFEILPDADSFYLVDYSMGRILSLDLAEASQNSR